MGCNNSTTFAPGSPSDEAGRPPKRQPQSEEPEKHDPEARAKAEAKERKGDQDPEATHNHRKALEVLGPARSLESVLGLVEAPLPTLEARSAEIMWLASVPEARAASGLTSYLQTTQNGHCKKGEELQIHAH